MSFKLRKFLGYGLYRMTSLFNQLLPQFLSNQSESTLIEDILKMCTCSFDKEKNIFDKVKTFFKLRKILVMVNAQ